MNFNYIYKACCNTEILKYFVTFEVNMAVSKNCVVLYKVTRCVC